MMRELCAEHGTFRQIVRDWLPGTIILAVTSVLCYLVATCLNWPSVAWTLAATATGFVLCRFARLNGYGISCWLSTVLILIVVCSVPQTHGLAPLLTLLILPFLVLLLLSCVIFLFVAVDDRNRRGRHCAACVFALSSLCSAVICVAESKSYTQHFEEMERTTQTLIALHSIAAEIDAIQARLGQLPANESELTALRGAPLPLLGPSNSVSYHRVGSDEYFLSCSLASFWGFGWDFFAWEVRYFGPRSQRRLAIESF